MFTIAFSGELEIRFISVSNQGNKTFGSGIGNVLKEFETLLFDENLLKACGRSKYVYRNSLWPPH